MGYYPGLWYPGYGSALYFWDMAASTAIPAKGSYTTRITWPDNSPLYDLYGYDMGDTILGSGNPGDDGVQYGLHLAVTGKAIDGSWGQISVWNSSALLDLGKKVSGSAASGGTLTYTLSIRNLTPVAQSFVLDDPIPANTTYLMGPGYNRSSNSIHVEGKVAPFMTNFVVVSVKVKPYTPPGTVITNTATLRDGALGDQATVVSTVPKR